jgi:hypothetical protein
MIRVSFAMVACFSVNCYKKKLRSSGMPLTSASIFGLAPLALDLPLAELSKRELWYSEKRPLDNGAAVLIETSVQNCIDEFPVL